MALVKKRKKKSSKNKCWSVFSEYIRRRDADEDGMVACISCGKYQHWKELDAGHYVAKSVSLALRFEERNVHPQCTACNRFRHGNTTQYAIALKKRYGPDILEELDEIRRNGEGFRISESDYAEMLERYKEKLLNLCKSDDQIKKETLGC